MARGVLVGAAVAVVLSVGRPPLAAAQATYGGFYLEPRAALTPGKADPRVAQSTIKTTICVAGYTEKVRPSTGYTSPLEDRQILAYGYRGPTRADFEFDHLIPLQLGGHPTAIANLWPISYENQAKRLAPVGFGAETKNQFGSYLKRAVCAGRLRLSDAQQQIARGWLASARKVGIVVGAVPTRTSAPTAPPGQRTVTPGAFCSGTGSKGVTVTGLSMTCSSATCLGVSYGDRNRWRSTVC